MTPPNLFMVTELMSRDLSALIHKRPSTSGVLPPPTHPMALMSALQIAMDVVKGLVRFTQS